MNAAMNNNEIARQQGCRKRWEHGRRKNNSMLSSVISVASRHKLAMTQQELLKGEQHDLSGIAPQVGNDAARTPQP
jgi:hypothetical protein